MGCQRPDPRVPAPFSYQTQISCSTSLSCQQLCRFCSQKYLSLPVKRKCFKNYTRNITSCRKFKYETKKGEKDVPRPKDSFHLVDFPVIFASSEYFHWVVIRSVTSQCFLTHLACLMFLAGWLEAIGEAGWRCKCYRKS